MFQKIINNRAYLLFCCLYATFLLAGVVFFLTLKHGDMVLFINRHSNEIFDPIMVFFTDLGLGSYMIILVLLLSFWKVRYSIMGLIDMAFVGIFAGVGKRLAFADRGRPMMYFYYDDFTRFIHTAELNYFFSFPSGHTMTAFAIMALLTYIVGKRWLAVVFFLLALMVGFSRMYLLQHFFLDVYFGSLFGMISCFLTIWLCESRIRVLSHPVLNHSVVGFFRRSRNN